MKNNHTQLTRLAAISLVLVMCLSALPMLAPSASAAPAAGEGRGYVCIMFDDGWMDIYQHGFPIMAAAGIPGTASIVTDWIGGVGGSASAPCMGVEELLDLQANGWTIGSHSLSHPDLTQMSLEEAKEEMSASKAALEAIGIDCSTFAYPHGTYNASLVNYGFGLYDRQRTTDGINWGMHVMGSFEPRSLEKAKELIDRAVATDSVLLLLHHHVEADGHLPGNNYNLHDLVDYIVETGIRPIGFADLPNSPHAEIYVWDGEGSTELASEAANWYQDIGGVIVNDVLPTNNSHVLFDDTSTKDCTWDLDASAVTVCSLTLGTGYTGTLTQGDVDIGIGDGGYLQKAGTFTGSGDAGRTFRTAGNFHKTGGTLTNTLSLIMVGAGTYYQSNSQSENLYSLKVSADVTFQSSAIIRGVSYMDVDEGATLTIASGRRITTLMYNTFTFSNMGLIAGPGTLQFSATNLNMTVSIGNVSAAVNIVKSTAGSTDVVFTLSDSPTLGPLTIQSLHANSRIDVDLNGHTLTASSIIVGTRGAIVGDGTIINAGDLDASAGSFDFVGHYVQADGGTITLGAGQSIPSLEIASDDGRTASWTMTATGAQAPIVTGLEPGVSYRW